MRITVCILLSFCLHVSASSYGQLVSLSGKNVPMKSVFKAIEEQTGYVVFCNKDDLARTSAIDIDIRSARLADFLDEALKDQPLTYRIADKTIILSEKKRIAYLPEEPVKGRITDGAGNPLPGTSIRIKGSQTGTVADAGGYFTIDAKSGDQLIISFIGYTEQSVTVPKSGKINITLIPLQQSLNEITINKGYYSTTKALNTGAVSSIHAKDIEQQPVSNPLQALQGRVPGVYIQQSTGLPGSAFTVRIRGRNSIRSNGNEPLYIVDGVPFSSQSLTPNIWSVPVPGTNPLNNLNPLDIESISILKDADATAIYGSRGANGVVLITTRKAKAGKTLTNVNVSTGFSQVAHKVKLLNTREYLDMRYEALRNDGIEPQPLDYDLTLWDTTRYTDWQEELIGKTGRTTNAQVSVSGGNASTRFLLSGNLFDERTVSPGNLGFKRLSGHASFSHTSPDQKVQADASVVYTGGINTLPAENFTKMAILLPPVAPALYDAEGKLNWQDFAWTNPLAYLKNTHENRTENLVMSASLGYRILPGLRAKAVMAYNTMRGKEIQKFPLSFYEPNVIDPAWNLTANARHTSSSTSSWNIEPQLEYQGNIAAGKLTVMVGGTLQESRSAYDGVYADGYLSDALLDNINAAPYKNIINTAFSKYAYNAFSARIQYNWLDKYLVNLTGRRDGSSRFGPNKQFANFGALGASWIFSTEPFMQHAMPFLSFGKLRTSYGITGNDQIGDYGYLSTYSATQEPYNGATAVVPTRLANANYAWEVNRKLELALELGFLKDRFMITADWYRNRTSNQLVGYSLSGVAGFDMVMANLPATVENTGWELEISSQNVRNRNFTWRTDINLTIPYNKLVAYPNLEGSSYGNSYVVGRSLFIRKTFHYTGVDPQTGKYTFEDVNKDGQITYPDDLTAYTTVGQRFFGGIQNTFRYKGVELSVFFQFVNQVGSNSLLGGYFNVPGTFGWSGAGTGNQPAQLVNRWRKSGDVAMYRRLTTNYEQDYNHLINSDATYTDASFSRLKNVYLSWELPASWTQRAAIQNLRLYLQAQNLLTFSKYEGFDPENQYNFTLPPLRVMTAGIQLIF